MNPPDLQSRIQQLLDDELPAGELAALEAELLEDSDALETYRSYIDLHCGLQGRGAFHSAVANVSIVPVDRVIALQRRRIVKTSLLAAAAVLLISAIALWLNLEPDAPTLAAGFRAAPGSDFTLTHPASGPGGIELSEGSRIVLDHGVAELKLPHDVLAIVEAPAAMTLLDDRTLQMDHGRAFFRVSSEGGEGFTVVTPHQRLVDLGTAFGVASRSDRDEVELHVFEGRVRVDDLDGKEGEIIKADRSVLLAGAQIEEELDVPVIAFRRELPVKVATLFVEDFESGLVSGRNYAVQIDPTAIRDLAGNRFPGIDDNETWNFVTALPDMVPVPVHAYSYGADAESQPQPTDFQNGLISDVGNLKLTDGRLGTRNWNDGTNVGFRNDKDNGRPQPHLTFDLGGLREVSLIKVWSVREFLGNDESVSISSSADGVTFSSPTTLGSISWSGGFSNINLRQASLDVSSLPGGRYYRLEFYDPGQWHMINEVQFGSDAAVPYRATAIRDAAHNPAPGPSPSLSKRDETPPAVLALHPANGMHDATPGEQLTMVFDEPIKLGTGRITLRDITTWSESELVVGDPRISVDGRFLTINPPADLADGQRQRAVIGGWEGDADARLSNPGGDGTWYRDAGLRDGADTRGAIGAMLGPVMATFGASSQRGGIRREIGRISSDSRYTVSVAIGVRAGDAGQPAAFLGYTIRLTSGGAVLAELSGDTPPGSPNSVTSVGFSWDSSSLPAGVTTGDPLVIEIAPNQASGLAPGYLDVDNVRVSAVGE